MAAKFLYSDSVFLQQKVKSKFLELNFLSICPYFSFGFHHWTDLQLLLLLEQSNQRLEFLIILFLQAVEIPPVSTFANRADQEMKYDYLQKYKPVPYGNFLCRD